MSLTVLCSDREEAEKMFKGWFLEALKEALPKNDVQDEMKYYSRKETADLLQISLPTLQSYQRTGLIKGHRIGSRVLFSRGDIEQALQSIPVRFSRR